MITITDKIMKRIRARGRGKWVCTARDFPDLGDRAAVDQALSRRTKATDLRRALRDWIGKDLARKSTNLSGWAVPFTKSLKGSQAVAVF